ncbi:MAG: ISL3 family transposase [Ilumatobacteraceae bacterium]
MRVTTAFNRLLRLPGTRVTAVGWTPDGLVVSVRPTRRLRTCPCGSPTRAVYDRTVRRWRHLDACGTRVWLEAEVCRVDCRSCGRVRTEVVPWARPGGRHTISFERHVLWCARRMDKTAVARLLRISWETVDAMIVRAVGDPTRLARLDGLRRIGVDEISYRRGHRYLTIVCDHDTGSVVWAREGRDAAALTEFYDALGPKRCKQLRAVSMDLGVAYRQATRAAAPRAKICADAFHLLKLASKTVDVVRARTVKSARDPNLRWALLKRPDHLNPIQQQLLEQLAAEGNDAWRAWTHREHLRAVLKARPRQATRAVDDWLATAAASSVVPVRNLAGRMAKHRQMIINTITTGISNGRLEGTNSKIRLLNHRGYGHHRPEALIALIMLACTPEPAL